MSKETTTAQTMVNDDGADENRADFRARCQNAAAVLELLSGSIEELISHPALRGSQLFTDQNFLMQANLSLAVPPIKTAIGRLRVAERISVGLE